MRRRSPSTLNNWFRCCNVCFLNKLNTSWQGTTTNGLLWIDLCGLPNDSNVTTDADFVSAMRKLLKRHNVPEPLLSEVSRNVLLPVAVLSVDDTACLVMRLARLVADKRSTVVKQLSASSQRLEKSLSRKRLVHVQGELVFETIQHLTNRLSVFILPREDLVITVHKFKIPTVDKMKEDWIYRYRKLSIGGLVRRLVYDSASTFLDAERLLAAELEELESSLYLGAYRPLGNNTLLQELYAMNRLSSAYSRVLRPLFRSFEEAALHSKVGLKSNSEVKHQVRAAQTMCDGLKEHSQALLSLQFSVAANQLEELTRVLTVYSTVFVPLELIASLFGMGFVGIIEFGSEPNSHWITPPLFFAFGALTMVWLRRFGVL